ncbi:MAG: DNA cytosine methyltransferase [Acidaminococcaceae bacterium]
MNYNCASFFAGVGGIDLAFAKHGFKTIYANEWDDYAAKTFEANNPIKADVRDINDIKNDEIPDFDIMLAGFPCQAFSVAGYRQGFGDEQGRGTLFFELERIFKDRKPKVIFLENVKNLVGHDDGNTFRVIYDKLKHAGYHVKYQVMNAMNYGNVPQNRERIYIVAFLDIDKYHRFDFPQPVERTKKIRDVIDFNRELDSKYYYNEKNCSFYDKLIEAMKNKDTVYQWRRVYVRENKSDVCPTLTANMGTGGHNVPLILTDYGIRKLTPQECFKIQGFPDSFIIPEGMSNTRAYKQAGNSVVVPVIERIAEEIKKVL